MALTIGRLSAMRCRSTADTSHIVARRNREHPGSYGSLPKNFFHQVKVFFHMGTHCLRYLGCPLVSHAHVTLHSQ